MTQQEMETAICVLQKQVAELQRNNAGFRQSEKVRIMNALDQLGVPAHLQGYGMLVRAIGIVTRSGGTLKLRRDVYPPIAEEYSLSVISVDRAIGYAVNAAFNRTNAETIQAFFGNSLDPHSGTPTNAQFIAAIVKKAVI